ncbi:hypothetical protein IIC68_00165, partial [archaeon]|nr:hypothetical protein [archaeon]
IRLLKDMRSFLRAAEARNNSAKAAWELAKESLPPGSAITKQKYIDWCRDTVDWMDEVYDAGLGGDYIEWIVRHSNTGFYDKGVKEVLQGGDDVVVNLFHEHRNMQRILKKFKEDGTFRGFENDAARFGSVFETSGDDLVYYTFDTATERAGRTLSYSNLKPAASTRTDLWVKTDQGEYIPWTQQSTAFIQNRIGGNPVIVQGNWKATGVFTPENITSRITNARTGPGANMHYGTKNVQSMLDTVREKNFVSRRYWNALDKIITQEDELIRSYFTIKGGAKWTVLPFGYWWAKKGFGVDGISQYRLPDTWHDLKFTHGDENIYDYAYIDFFANEGSDQGDLFLQMIQKLPWTLIIDQLSDKYNPLKNLYDSLTKNQLRNETENLAFYLVGPEDCINCTMVLRSPDLTEFSPFFFVEDKKITAYILEDTISEKARNKGQTLIVFAGHTNLEGESGDDEGVPIDLAEAIRNESIADRDLRAEKPRTCTQALKDLDFAGANIGAVLPKSSAVGAVLGGLQSITYATFFWAGIFSTVAVQVVIAPQLNGCVDVEEGYYAHYFVPVQEEQDEQSGTSEKSTEKVSEFISNFKETFADAFEGDANTFTQKAAQDLGDELDRFVKDSKNNDIVQATMTMQGLSSGQLESRDLFYFWCGKGCEIVPAIYRTDGSEEIRGVNDVNVNIDFEKGEITVNGDAIVTNADHVRFATTNLGIPAIEIPNTITETCIEPTLDIAIEINAQGEARVLNNDLLNCIRQGVLEQTGLPMEIGVNKLNDAFGPLELVVTNTHPNIRPLGDKIIAEGVPRKIADGKDAKILILANKQVELSSSNDQETGVGTLDSLQFANGSLIVKPNGCFITWLRHNEAGILPKDLVRGLKTDLDREFNEQTQCQEPVIDFELFGDVDSDFRTNQVNKFNQSIQYLGPFTVFETPTQRFVISAEQENGVCKDRLRIIDKETGEVRDLVGTITQTPDGFKITTEDGKEHEVKFSTKDGAPFLQLDEEKPELLTSAQGKNGSFYYDPDKGLWFAENAQLLPLIEAFRDGIAASVAPNGEVTANASGNILNFNAGQDDSTFLNLPSLPEERVLIAIILILLVTTFVFVQRKS